MKRKKKKARQSKIQGPRVVAVGRITKDTRETHITFESMSPMGQAAVRRVFSSTIRAEEIANL